MSSIFFFLSEMMNVKKATNTWCKRVSSGKDLLGWKCAIKRYDLFVPFCVLLISAWFRLRILKAVIESVNILSSDKISFNIWKTGYRRNLKEQRGKSEKTSVKLID